MDKEKSTLQIMLLGRIFEMCKAEIYRIDRLQFPVKSDIIYVQRVAFLRKSRCRTPRAFFVESGENGGMRESFISKSCSRNA